MPPRSSPERRNRPPSDAAGAETPSWLADALRADVVRRSLRVALVIGALLVAINHGDHLLSGAVRASGWLKIALTFLVPYGVSTYASVGAIRQGRRI
jgi:hypothetical protein